MWELAAAGELFIALAASIYRVALGFAIGTAAGVMAGLGAGLVPGVRHFFDPLVSFLYPIPKIAFLPVFLLLFGLGHASKFGIIAFSTFFPVFIASRHAVLAINPILVWARGTWGRRPQTIFFRVIIPAAAPQLFAGIRIGLAHAFVVLFAAELIGSKAGLANLISYGEEWVRFDLMFAGIVCFAVLGFVSRPHPVGGAAPVLRGHLIGTEEQVMRGDRAGWEADRPLVFDSLDAAIVAGGGRQRIDRVALAAEPRAGVDGLGNGSRQWPTRLSCFGDVLPCLVGFALAALSVFRSPPRWPDPRFGEICSSRSFSWDIRCRKSRFFRSSLTSSVLARRRRLPLPSSNASIRSW